VSVRNGSEAGIVAHSKRTTACGQNRTGLLPSLQ
jgi:hypothetical protein